MSVPGAGCQPAQGILGNDLSLLLLLLILFPDLFGGENPMLLFILLIWLASSGRV